MIKPNFFIVGAPKCGTTSLATWLAEHPQIFITSIKEPHHYDTDQNYDITFRDRADYVSLFEGANESHQAVGEASVWYLYSKTAIPNILTEIPSAKFIVMIRNPIEMVASLHQQLINAGLENVKSLNTAWHLQDARRKGSQIPLWCHEPKFLLYKEACSLGSQLERIYSLAPKENVLPVFLDDLKSDPRRSWLEILSFLGVADDGRTEFPVINEATERRTLLLLRLFSIYGRLTRLVGIKTFGTGASLALDRLNTRKKQWEPLRPEFRKELVDAFEDEILLLEKLADRNLHKWLQ